MRMPQIAVSPSDHFEISALHGGETMQGELDARLAGIEARKQVGCEMLLLIQWHVNPSSMLAHGYKKPAAEFQGGLLTWLGSKLTS